MLFYGTTPQGKNGMVEPKLPPPPARDPPPQDSEGRLDGRL
jgi:hypothetical protein